MMAAKHQQSSCSRVRQGVFGGERERFALELGVDTRMKNSVAMCCHAASSQEPVPDAKSDAVIALVQLHPPPPSMRRSSKRRTMWNSLDLGYGLRANAALLPAAQQTDMQCQYIVGSATCKRRPEASSSTWATGIVNSY
jgi:hypothetical protein